jgi:alpha-galactosidase
MMRFLTLFSIVLPAVLVGENKWGVGKLPALGWNSWNAYKCDITEAKFMSAAKKIVELGLRVRQFPFPFKLIIQHTSKAW